MRPRQSLPYHFFKTKSRGKSKIIILIILTLYIDLSSQCDIDGTVFNRYGVLIMFRDAASKRLEQGPLTVSELDIIKTLLSLCAPGYAVRKIPICIKIEIGEKSDRPVNPITGVEYGTETGAELKQLMDKYNLIGQFAGEKQWLRGGRSLKIGEKPILEYPSIYSSSVKQIMIRIFSFEQTRYM